MKATLCAVSLAFLSATTLSAKAFEGKAQFQTYGPGGKKGPVMEMYLKDGKTRVETEARGHQSIVIMDQKAKTMLMLMPEKKMYMQRDLKGLKAKSEDHEKVSFKKTGHSEVIAGYKAEEWDITRGTHTTHLWGSSDLGSYVGAEAGGHGGIEIPAEIREKGLFPLRVSNGEEGKGGGMEAVKVEPGSLPASLFELPSGYTEMKGMGGMPGAGGDAGALPPDAAARMQKAMENMTPAQRAMMEKMMQKHNAGQ